MYDWCSKTFNLQSKFDYASVIFPCSCAVYIYKIMILLNNFSSETGGGWVRQRCQLSYIIGVSNWDWLTVGQGLLFLQQVTVEGGGYFYFFCFFTSIHFPLSPLSLSFISSTISSISSLSLGDGTKWPTRVGVSLNPNTIKKKNSSETTWPVFTKFHVDLSVEMGLRVCSNDIAPLTVISIYGKKIMIKKTHSSFSRPRTAEMMILLSVAMTG